MITLLQIILCAYLWRLAGKGGFTGARMLRYIAVPLVLMLSHPLTWMLLVVTGIRIGLMFLSGYGDKAPIRKFFKWLFRSDGYLTNFCTRFVNGLLWTLGNIPLSILIAITGTFVKNDVASESLTGAIIGAQ